MTVVRSQLGPRRSAEDYGPYLRDIVTCISHTTLVLLCGDPPLPYHLAMSVKPIAPVGDIFDDDDEGWQDMPVIREDKEASGLDDEDIKRYHYVTPTVKGSQGSTNATGAILDVDAVGQEWRSKLDQNESEYTRLRVNEEEDADEVHLRTRYLFDEDKAMTPLSQMQATKNLLTEAQRIAYVGLCALTSREMAEVLKSSNKKELKAAGANMELWAMKILGRLYYHMELETQGECRTVSQLPWP